MISTTIFAESAILAVVVDWPLFLVGQVPCIVQGK